MTPTQRVEHAVDVCTDCGTHLAGGWVRRTREVIEIPVAPVEVIEHIFIARVCPRCRRRHVPQVELEGAVVGQSASGGFGSQFSKPDSDPAGRGAAALPDHPMVP